MKKQNKRQKRQLAEEQAMCNLIWRENIWFIEEMFYLTNTYELKTMAIENTVISQTILGKKFKSVL